MKPTRILAVLTPLALVIALHSFLEGASWRRVRTENFEVVGAQSPRALRELAIELERFRQVVEWLLPESVLSYREPVRVIIFPNEKAFAPFRGRRRNVGGYFIEGSPPHIVVNGKQWKGNTRTVFHELQHFILSNNLSRLPAWLNEGLAEFYSTFELVEDGQSVLLGKPIQPHVGRLRGQGFRPLERLFAVDYWTDDYRDIRFYAQSWLVTHFLLMGNEQSRFQEFAFFLKALNAGLPQEVALQKAFDLDNESLDKGVRKYARGLTLPFLRRTLTEPIEFNGTVDAEVLSEAEKLYYFGELHIRRGDAKLAEQNLLESIQQDPRHAASLVALAVLRFDDQQEVEELLGKAIQIDPTSYRAHFYLGELRKQKDDLRGALASFQETTRLNPDWGRGHTALGLTLLELSDFNRAEEAFRQSIRFTPYDPFVYYSRSFVYYKLGKYLEAATDAAVFLRKWGQDNRYTPYMGFILHFARRQLGDSEQAAEYLSTYSRADNSEWPYPVYRYLQGQIDATELLKLASTNDQRTEAHAYIGLDLVLKGDQNGGVEHLTWVEQNGNRRFAEFDLAVAELRRLRRDSSR